MDKKNILDLIKQVEKRNRKPEDDDKWPKQAAGYIYRPETKYHCEECVFSKENSTKCALFGTTETIKPFGGCNLYLHKHPDSDTAKQTPYYGLVTKIEAGYTENKQGFSCGRCEYFLSGKQECKRVRNDFEGDTPGIIDSHGCCNRWDKDDERGDMTDEQLNKLFEKK